MGKIMDYKSDIGEIVNLIRCLNIPKKNVDFSVVLGRMTEQIEESYLMQRATLIQSEIAGNAELSESLQTLALVCDNDYCDKCPVKKYCNHYIGETRKLVNDRSLKMIDLFCGSGGLSLGFTQEGFITTLANDIEPCCVDTYAHNHPETPRDRIWQGDIKELVDNIDGFIASEHVDVVVGGPPCQGFSMANRQRLIDDPRNHLYKSFVEIVNKVRPPFFVMENVKGMATVAEQVVEDFKGIGYETSYHILNARDYGVPQNRERLIYIGNRVGIDNEFIFLEIFHLSGEFGRHVLKDALYGLRPLEASRIKNSTQNGSTRSGWTIETNISDESNSYLELINQGKQFPFVLNHKARYNNDRDIEIFSRLNQGDKSDDPKIADIMPYARRNHIFKDKYYKLEEEKPSKTITAHMKFDCNMYIHPTQARGLTPREAARIQSYPDDYYFRGPYTKTYMQIGNSVPPLLGRAIASVVKGYIIDFRKDD